MLPNFLIAGTQKSGTTSMWHVFREHPDIFMSDVKEVRFFASRDRFAKGMDWYESHFTGADGNSAVGEASPGCLYRDWAPAAIARSLPDIKLIFCLRNPIDRAYSEYWHYRRKLTESRPFRSIVRNQRSGYVRRGFYLRYLTPFLDTFPETKISVVLYDKLAANPVDFYGDCFRFLSVHQRTFASMEVRHNSSTVPLNPVYRLLFNHPALTRFLPGSEQGVARRTVLKLARFGRHVRFKYPRLDPDLR